MPELPNWTLTPATFPFIAKVTCNLISTSDLSRTNSESLKLSRKISHLLASASTLMSHDFSQCHILYVVCLYKKLFSKVNFTGIYLGMEDMYMIFLLSMIIAFKQQFDEPMTNATWVKFTEVSLVHLNRMERQYLRALKYDTLITTDHLKMVGIQMLCVDETKNGELKSSIKQPRLVKLTKISVPPISAE